MATRDIVFGAAGAAGAAPTYVDDVFSTYLYTGNGSTQTITNGIDLAGQGGLVWLKSRSSFSPTEAQQPNHFLVDTARGSRNFLSSNTTNGTGVNCAVSAFNASGFSLDGQGDGASLGGRGNLNGVTYASWTFRKAPKFFDVVTYTGNGSTQTINHALGQTPGTIIVKATSQSGTIWAVWHRGSGTPFFLQLNTADASLTSTYNAGNAFLVSAPTDSNFVIKNIGFDGSAANAIGVTYVAYLFAHDTASDGLIQCGSFTGNGSASGPTVTLGWEPQWVLVKSSTLGTTSSQWSLLDNMRGSLALSSQGNDLFAQSSAAENTGGAPVLVANATGFNLVSSNDRVNGSGHTYVYIAIRRPNKPPTTGTQVFTPVARTGTGSSATVDSFGFPLDSVIGKTRGTSTSSAWIDRLRGGDRGLSTESTASEAAGFGLQLDRMNGYLVPNGLNPFNASGATTINWGLRRAPGFFDVVTYTGDGVNGRTVAHNLGVAPELIIAKSRNAVGEWGVSTADNGYFGIIYLNQTSERVGAGSQYITGSSSNIAFPNSTPSNVSGSTFVAYLFASLSGISKIGTYTGNGSSQTINCGFTTGARFVLIKRTDGTGDWYVWDTARGIVSGNDPHLSLNTTAAEVTSNDSIDPDTSGFIVNQLAATNINVTSATYIFLAIA